MIIEQDHQKAVARRVAEGKAFKAALDTGNTGVSVLPDQKAGRSKNTREKKLNLNSARKYKPVTKPAGVLFHDPNTQRIRAYYMYKGTRKSHGCQLAYGQDVALRVLLKWQWSQHERRYPNDKCPWKLDIEPGIQ